MRPGLLLIGAVMANFAMMGWSWQGRTQARDELRAYQEQEVTLGPPDHPYCTHSTSVGSLVLSLQSEPTFIHNLLEWVYVCGLVQDDKAHRGVSEHCERKDRCA